MVNQPPTRSRGATLSYFDGEKLEVVEHTVGTPAWFAWLDAGQSFNYKIYSFGVGAGFTVRCENGKYWKAYKRIDGKNCFVVL